MASHSKPSLMNLIIRLTLNTFALLIVENIVPGFEFESLQAAVVAAVVIGVVNTSIKPILQLIALPITVLTFGIFALLINVFLLWSVAYVVPGFEVAAFSTALIASLVLSLVSWFLNKLAD